ncbi:COG complex component [Marasmius fiardii PR-910]|nr:COG complex component [Marasmius fiardii PR-910]
MSIFSPQPSSADPFQLERLAEELVSREISNNEDTTHDLPEYVPLSHQNPYLNAETFDVEEFLLSRSHTSLQDLKTELRDYLLSLKEELVQLINDDYEAFISLSTDLKGEGDRLNNLKAPLAGLKQEIQISKDELRAIQDAIEEKLRKRAALREEKALLHLLLKISESVLRLETLLLISSTDSSEMDGIQPVNPNEEHPEEREGNHAKHLSRVASEYTQLLYHANKARAEKCLFVDEIQWRIDRIQSTISSDLDQLFGTTLSSLTEKRAEGEKSKLIADLTECLKTYDVLGLWRDAEDVLRREVVRPFIKKTIFSGTLSAPHSPLLPHTPAPQAKTPAFMSLVLAPRTPYTPFTSRAALFHLPHAQAKGTSPYAHILDESEDPLAALYSQILRFVERELNGIMEIAEKVSLKSLSSRKPDKGGSLTPRFVAPAKDESEDVGARGFEVLANVIWEEFGRAIMDELGSSVFASGRPNEFKQHHEITQAFLRSLEFLSPSLHSIENMRRHPIYVAFENRWQLPVYFQIRWKEIVNKVEESLAKGEVELNEKSSSSAFKSSQASEIWIAITACWSAEVFIPQLSHRFWKLTLQLLSRYKQWLEEAVIASYSTRRSAIVNEKIAASRSSTPVPITESTPDENLAADDATLRRCTAVITDIKVMQKSITKLWNEEISMMLPDVHDGDDDGISAEVALQKAVGSLAGLVTPLSRTIVSVLSRRACDALLPVRSIPSQLRAMSNKRPPSEASPFVATIMRPVKVFFGITGTGDAVGASLKEEFLVQYSSEVFEEVSQRYASDLTAIQKREDSLKRLKIGKKKTFSLFGSKDDENQESRDEERIRVQLILDVEAFERDAHSLGLNLEDSHSFKSLNELVKANELSSERNTGDMNPELPLMHAMTLHRLCLGMDV